jgi:transcription elongation factor GreA
MPKEKIFVTKEGYKKLKKEVERLEKEFAEVSRGKAEAAEVGGDVWHDNPAFEAIEQRQRILLRQIAEAKDALSRVVIIEEESRAGGEVKIGSTVEVEFEDGELMTVKIGDYTEADPSKGIISYKSPLGSTLLGAAVGEKREYRPGDRTKTFVIKSVK